MCRVGTSSTGSKCTRVPKRGPSGTVGAAGNPQVRVYSDDGTVEMIHCTREGDPSVMVAAVNPLAECTVVIVQYVRGPAGHTVQVWK